MFLVKKLKGIRYGKVEKEADSLGRPAPLNEGYRPPVKVEELSYHEEVVYHVLPKQINYVNGMPVESVVPLKEYVAQIHGANTVIIEYPEEDEYDDEYDDYDGYGSGNFTSNQMYDNYQIENGQDFFESNQFYPQGQNVKYFGTDSQVGVQGFVQAPIEKSAAPHLARYLFQRASSLNPTDPASKTPKKYKFDKSGVHLPNFSSESFSMIHADISRPSIVRTDSKQDDLAGYLVFDQYMTYDEYVYHYGADNLPNSYDGVYDGMYSDLNHYTGVSYGFDDLNPQTYFGYDNTIYNALQHDNRTPLPRVRHSPITTATEPEIVLKTTKSLEKRKTTIPEESSKSLEKKVAVTLENSINSPEKKKIADGSSLKLIENMFNVKVRENQAAKDKEIIFPDRSESTTTVPILVETAPKINAAKKRPLYRKHYPKLSKMAALNSLPAIREDSFREKIEFFAEVPTKKKIITGTVPKPKSQPNLFKTEKMAISKEKDDIKVKKNESVNLRKTVVEPKLEVKPVTEFETTQLPPMIMVKRHSYEIKNKITLDEIEDMLKNMEFDIKDAPKPEREILMANPGSSVSQMREFYETIIEKASAIPPKRDLQELLKK
jgi:hypothetical protein